jgi:outer membrane lipoprotein carrier protein
MKRTLLICLALITAAVSANAALTGSDVLRKIRRAYNRTDSFQAGFEQTFTWKLAGSTQTMNGQFSMAKPHRFRIQTEVQTVVTDGETVWSYSPATRQVILNDFDPATMPLRPDNFLFLFPDDERVEYVGNETVGEETIHVVDVAPRDASTGIVSARVWVDEDTWTARKVVYVNVNQDTTTYILHDVVRNERLPEGTFMFAIPPETDVVDFRAASTQ